MSSNYYAVKVGHHPGIYTNWNDCKQSITGYSNPVFRKFGTIEEAQNFINSKKEKTFFFDFLLGVTDIKRCRTFTLVGIEGRLSLYAL